MILGFCLFLVILTAIIISQIIFERQARQHKRQDKLDEAAAREKPKPINPEARPWTVSGVARTHSSQNVPPLPTAGSRPGTAVSRPLISVSGSRLSVPEGRPSTPAVRPDSVGSRPMTSSSRVVARGSPDDMV
jgi:hypothetical protein